MHQRLSTRTYGGLTKDLLMTLPLHSALRTIGRQANPGLSKRGTMVRHESSERPVTPKVLSRASLGTGISAIFEATRSPVRPS
jgi:hypothetical protein